MKKIFSFAIAVSVLIFLLPSCDNKSKKAFEASKVAYENVNSAYKIAEDYGADIYEAWRLGIYDDDEILEKGCAYLAKELHISESEIKEGIAYTLAEMDEGWENCSEEDRADYRENADYTFVVMEDNLFSWCVLITSNSYAANGKVKEAQEYLDAAKEQMKELSQSYSDYEHYPSLKGYYTTTNSFFDFCQNPTGSFEQIKTTIESYRSTARDYKADLDYIFED